MCRNIRPLFNFEPPSTPDEIEAAARQYVRKVSGMTKPAGANDEAFEDAIEAITAATAALLDALVTRSPPRDRETEIAKRREANAKRFSIRT